jgi:N-methylhydantoinase A
MYLRRRETNTGIGMADWRLAVDIGGTFTDAVLVDASSGKVVIDKTLTTPQNPLVGVKSGVGRLLNKAGLEPSDITGPIVHATTLITNALIERKTAPAALVTTTGFADTLLIRNEHRYDMYDLQIEFPEPPIPRSRTFEITERTSAGGEVLERPCDEDISALVEAVAGAAVEAVAICFLHSYADPTNERLVAAAISSRLALPTCISSDIAPQIREYPRMVTTACNAVTMPVIGRYLREFQDWLREEGFGSSLLMMLSNGGVVAAEEAARAPIRLVESGPAAGALAAAWYARRLEERRLLSLDMGGTTAKSCLIEDFEPALTVDFEIARMYRFKKGSGLPVVVPSVDLVEIGAGGGSIARLDDMGLLKVGPDSAGAEPGPACYGSGGTSPTVTDADLVLGKLDASYFLGGEMPLDEEAAMAAVAGVAAGLSHETVQAAAGIDELVDQNMAAAARMHAVERGVDLRGVSIIAFGGAGPVHACGVADLLSSPKVIFPSNASVLSAFGTLVTPIRIDLARSRLRLLGPDVDPEAEGRIGEMRDEAQRVLESAGAAARRVTFRYGIDARYRGQGNEITVWLGEGPSWPVGTDEVEKRFGEEYESVYGMVIPDVPVEVVTWRVSAFAPPPAVETAHLTPTGQPMAKGKRLILFKRGHDPVETPVFERNALGAGVRVEGPAIVEERETTCVIRPGWHAEVTSDGSIVAIPAPSQS